MATYAVGDIQGCYSELQDLLGLIGFNPDRDKLWLVGDLVNRGPESLEVLRFVKSLGSSAIAVLGNHDLHLILRAEGLGRESKDDTIAPILKAEDRDELMAWLRSLPLFHVEGDYAMVHAGLLPQWSVAQATELAAEASAALSKKKKYIDFLQHMWGSKPDHWQNDLGSWDRLRVVVNAMTRMRFCSLSGAMEFHAKGQPEDAPNGYLPWFAIPERASRDHTIICGHWSALGLHIDDGVCALDTGCLWGGRLTAMRLEDRRIFQVPSRQPMQRWTD